jgi:hypothetical protein
MSWEAIPGWNSDIIPFYRKLAEDLPQGARFVEVGVLFGGSIAAIGSMRPDLELWAVDTWAETVLDSPGAPFEAVAAKYPTTWRAFLGLMGEHAPDVLDRLHVVRAASCDVTVPCADVVFIDAAHDEANVRADIDHWRTMVKPGGWLCGHDYQDAYPGVQAAVRAKLGDPEMGPGDWSSVWIVRQWSLLPPPPGGPARHGQ